MFVEKSYEEYLDNWFTWEDFKEKLVYENRFFLKHEVLEKSLKEANLNKITIGKETLFHRARIYTNSDYINIESLLSTANQFKGMTKIDNESKSRMQDYLNKKFNQVESNFWGYPKGENLMPPKGIQIKGGRGNPFNIRYLYLSDSPYTALSEVRPLLNSKVSIAKITNTCEKNIADFSRNLDSNEFYNKLTLEFSSFCANEEIDYLPTQYIAELIKYNGFDGIKYRSSLHRGGINYMFFSDEQFDDKESKLYTVDEIAIKSSCSNTTDLPKVTHPEYFTMDDLRDLANHALTTETINNKK